jgi:uncharacterized protein YndB with AHSA1/START domain
MIAPLDYQLHVKVAPVRAFELFTARMSDWWPRGKTLGKPHAAIVLEPRPGGRWFERDADGHEITWGRVVAWEPPARLLLDWQLGTDWTFDPALHTAVEVRFSPADGGGTLVTLEHRDLERFGRDAAAHVAKLNGGWPSRLADFGRHADATA